MSGPANATSGRGGRVYTHPVTGERFPSVTTVLSVALAKPALVGWAAKAVATAAVTQRRDWWGRAELDEDDAIKWLKGRPYAESRTAADLGSRLHALAEGHALDGVMRDLHDDERGMVKQYLAWVERWQPKWEATEATVINRTLGYAGTMDGLVHLPGIDGLQVLDHKTGKTGPYPEWAVQLAAYAMGEHILLPDGTEQPMPAVAGAVALRIRPKFYALHRVTADLGSLTQIFGHMCRIHAWTADGDEPFTVRLDDPEPAPVAQKAG